LERASSSTFNRRSESSVWPRLAARSGDRLELLVVAVSSVVGSLFTAPRFPIVRLAPPVQRIDLVTEVVDVRGQIPELFREFFAAGPFDASPVSLGGIPSHWLT
jgi:hypothetical protein